MTGVAAALRSRKARALIEDPLNLARVLVAALDGRSTLCERTASGRPMSGPRNADAREALRAEALACAQLADFLDRTPAGETLIALIASRIKGGGA